MPRLRAHSNQHEPMHLLRPISNYNFHWINQLKICRRHPRRQNFFENYFFCVSQLCGEGLSFKSLNRSVRFLLFEIFEIFARTGMRRSANSELSQSSTGKHICRLTLYSSLVYLSKNDIPCSQELPCVLYRRWLCQRGTCQPIYL